MTFGASKLCAICLEKLDAGNLIIENLSEDKKLDVTTEP